MTPTHDSHTIGKCRSTLHHEDSYTVWSHLIFFNRSGLWCGPLDFMNSQFVYLQISHPSHYC